MLLAERNAAGESPERNTMRDMGIAHKNVCVVTSIGDAVRIAASLRSVYAARKTALARAVTIPAGFKVPNPLTTSCVTKSMPIVARPRDTPTLNFGSCLERRSVHRTTRTGAE